MVFLTKHEKESVVAPILEAATGCELVVEKGFDTDQLGTFSREIKRKKSQLETARKKIKKGLKLAKADLGVASEGSFGSHPVIPIAWNVEMVVLFDKKEKIEVVGMYEGAETNWDHMRSNQFLDVQNFAEKSGFPEHHLILRPDDERSKHIIKGIHTQAALKQAFDECQMKSKSGFVFVETDMRAHANPTRMRNIEKATQDLVNKLLNFCPRCQAPGFALKEVISGLPCAWCGRPSDLTLKVTYQCQKCGHKADKLHPNGETAPPQYCHYCNP